VSGRLSGGRAVAILDGDGGYPGGDPDGARGGRGLGSRAGGRTGLLEALEARGSLGADAPFELGAALVVAVGPLTQALELATRAPIFVKVLERESAARVEAVMNPESV
jgi:hypothetical protein